MTTEDITLVIDTREQMPLFFKNLLSIRGTLQTADYSIQGLEHLFAVEKKSIADLVGSVIGEYEREDKNGKITKYKNRDRFERELHRLRGFDFKRLLIVGTEDDIRSHNYRSNAHPNSILGSIYTFEVRYGIPVVWGGDEENSALLIERWADRYAREIDKLASWRD